MDLSHMNNADRMTLAVVMDKAKAAMGETERYVKEGKPIQARAARAEAERLLDEADSLTSNARLDAHMNTSLDAPPPPPWSLMTPAQRQAATAKRSGGSPSSWDRFLATVAADDGTQGPDYRSEFGDYLASRGRHVGKVLHETNREHSALTVGSDVGGGYLAPADMREEILSRLPALSEILSLCTIVQARGNPVSWPRVQAKATDGSIYTSAGVGSMVAEIPGATDGQNEQAFGRFEISIKRARYMARPSLQIVEDVDGLLDFLIGDASKNLTLLAEQQVIAGTGIGKNCLGVIHQNTAAEGSQTEDQIGTTDISGTTADQITNLTTDAGSAPKIIDLIYAVPAQYRRQSSFRVVMASDSEKKVRKLVDGNGRYFWTPNGGFGAPESGILGYPKAVSEFMQSGGTDANKVMLAGDFAELFFVPRSDIRVQIATERYADTDEIGVFVRWRFGTGIANCDAFRLGIV